MIRCKPIFLYFCKRKYDRTNDKIINKYRIKQLIKNQYANQ